MGDGQSRFVDQLLNSMFGFVVDVLFFAFGVNVFHQFGVDVNRLIVLVVFFQTNSFAKQLNIFALESIT